MPDSELADGLIGNIAPLLALHKELVDAGLKLEYHPGGTSPHTGYGRAFATADWHASEGIWRVYFPANAHAHQVYHELLHARFKNVVGAPVMAACQNDEALRRNVQELDNDFDHAYVVPLEIAEYPEAVTYWEADFRRTFGDLPSPSLDQLSEAQRKLTLFRGWLILPFAMPIATVTEMFRSELLTGGWLEAANTMTKRVRNAGANKAQAVQAFRDALGFDFPSAARVMYSTL